MLPVFFHLFFSVYNGGISYTNKSSTMNIMECSIQIRQQFNHMFFIESISLMFYAKVLVTKQNVFRLVRSLWEMILRYYYSPRVFFRPLRFSSLRKNKFYKFQLEFQWANRYSVEEPLLNPTYFSNYFTNVN